VSTKYDNSERSGKRKRLKEEVNCRNEELILEIKEAEKDDDKDIKTV
jgi:hypothetical protein